MAVGDAAGLQVAVRVESAMPHEVLILVQGNFGEIFVAEPIERSDWVKNAYDSERLGRALAETRVDDRRHRRNRKNRHSRWPRSPQLPSQVEDRTAVCLASEITAALQSGGNIGSRTSSACYISPAP